jgi:hypothetical protein
MLMLYGVLILLVFLYIPMWGDSNYPYRLLDKIRDGVIKHKHSILGKPLNVDTCHDNLIVFKKVLDSCDIPFMLSEGTALGMYRDGKLIENDDDIDTAVWGSDMQQFLTCAKPKLEESGFVFSHSRENFLSFFRKGEKIDVAIVGYGLCEPGRCNCKELIPHLQQFTQIQINGVSFNIPAQESYYVFLYSKDWRTPKQDKSNYGDRNKE